MLFLARLFLLLVLLSSALLRALLAVLSLAVCLLFWLAAVVLLRLLLAFSWLSACFLLAVALALLVSTVLLLVLGLLVVTARLLLALALLALLLTIFCAATAMAGVTTAAVAGAMMFMSSWVKSPCSQLLLATTVSERAAKLLVFRFAWVSLMRANGVLMAASFAAVATILGALFWLALKAVVLLSGMTRAACKGVAGMLSFTLRAGVALMTGAALITAGVLATTATAGFVSALLAAIKSTPLWALAAGLALLLLSCAKVVVLPWPHLLGNCFHARDNKLPLS